MKTIYVDSNFKLHVTDDGTMTALETGYFDGKCDAYIEGYCYCDGMFYPWKPSAELEAAQEEHEREHLADLEGFARIILGGDSV